MRLKNHLTFGVLLASKRLREAVPFLLTALVISLPRPARADQVAVVDPGSVIVTNFKGWGTSLCWWANVVGGYSNREAYADLAFSRLKLNIVRYNIGGGENPGLHNSMPFRARMEGFEPTNGVWNWNADANQRWMLRAAIARGADHVEAFANSPPWWMTVSGSVTGSADGSSNNLRTDCERPFAAYLATVVSKLSVLDHVRFDTVTPMNEPSAAWWTYGGKQEGCHISADQQARLVRLLRSELDSRGQTNTGVVASEENTENGTIDSLRDYDADALRNVARFTTHTYSTNHISRLREWAASRNRPLWVSEYGHNDSTGMLMARRIHDDIALMGAQAWVYWQVVDNGGGWGLLYNPEAPSTSNRCTTTCTVNESFYVLGQFSQFIRPGCQILKVEDTNSLAAYHPTKSTLVIVAVNDSTNNASVTYDLSSFGGLPSRVAVCRTSATENIATLPALSVSHRRFTSILPAQSVTTHVLNNVTPALARVTPPQKQQ
jgi:O-glycosyl hydrolase